jgi:hypothetical protein
LETNVNVRQAMSDIWECARHVLLTVNTIADLNNADVPEEPFMTMRVIPARLPAP